eukprot:TRINITY_DN7250_c0_g1_i1.p2 TRINITY_DN7250_c0_g1~~TRINITY_DN7250_c0_g1_i1.p2  ORF type:complete len:54 (+),score=7.93 TRINITY_DN7250_c0_g1_i1:201-362(+)
MHSTSSRTQLYSQEYCSKKFFFVLNDMFSAEQHLIMGNFGMCRRLEKATWPLV